MWMTPTNKIIIRLSQNRSWTGGSKPAKPLLQAWTRSTMKLETPSTIRIRFSPWSVQQNMAERILPWKWLASNEPFKLSFNCFTIVLGKVTEIMINVRLLNGLQQKETLPKLQRIGRAKWTTIDHLVSLEATVRKAQVNSETEQVVSIFFDMEKKVYDFT